MKRKAILRLMRYALKAQTAKDNRDLVLLADLRTSADDCRIAIRSAS